MYSRASATASILYNPREAKIHDEIKRRNSREKILVSSLSRTHARNFRALKASLKELDSKRKQCAMFTFRPIARPSFARGHAGRVLENVQVHDLPVPPGAQVHAREHTTSPGVFYVRAPICNGAAHRPRLFSLSRPRAAATNGFDETELLLRDQR